MVEVPVRGLPEGYKVYQNRSDGTATIRNGETIVATGKDLNTALGVIQNSVKSNPTEASRSTSRPSSRVEVPVQGLPEGYKVYQNRSDGTTVIVNRDSV